MNNRSILRVLSLSAFLFVVASTNQVKAEEIKSVEPAQLTYDSIVPAHGITTNQLEYYTLNEKEIGGISSEFLSELENLKLSSGYYVLDNEEYGIKDTDVYVMISLGKRNTEGYGIKVNSVEDIEGISSIIIEETKPSIDALVAQVVTYPYTVIRFSQGTPNVKVTTDKGVEMSSLESFSELRDTGWRNLKAYYDVVEDKEWLITFNRDISIETISDVVIYLRDSSGRKIPIEIASGEGNNTVKVIPVEKYNPGEIYYLFISKNTDKQLDSLGKLKGYRMMFQIKPEVDLNVS